ncbi:MAG: orotidine-5'-phosphate decarboxylase [Vicinamibacteria bacterium]
MPRLEPRDRLIFALDVADRPTAEKLVSSLHDEVGLFKIGIELCLAEGARGIEDIVRSIGGPSKIFLDLKIGDIPRTARASQSPGLIGRAALLTVRLNEGREVVQSLVRAAGKTKVLGVTLLTSMDERDTRAIGLSGSPDEIVLRLASLAKDLGCHGVICAAREARAVKETCGKDFLVVTPGIRPPKLSAGSKDPQDDQKRVATPAEAIRAGADYIVVGRPIRTNPDPRQAAREIVRQIEEGL